MKKALHTFAAVFTVAITISLSASTSWAQAPQTTDQSAVQTEAEDKVTVQIAQAAPAKPAEKPKDDAFLNNRFWEIQTFQFSDRYRSIATDKDVITNNQLQYKLTFNGRVKLDAEGKYSVNFGVASGNKFVGGWNNWGVGIGGAHQGWDSIFLKNFYLSAKPIQGVEFQVGGIGINRGINTEMTTYDNDGYLMGTRVTVKRPKDVWFDEISVTSAYLGDLTTPNAFRRLHRFGRSNYQQFLVTKNVGKSLQVSGDLTNEFGVSTLRQGVAYKTPKSIRVLSLLRVEIYERLENRPDFGYSVYGEKAFNSRFTLGAAYIDIDPNYGGLNGDFYNKGRRIYVVSSYKANDYISFKGEFTQGFANAFAIANNTRMDLILVVDAKQVLARLF